MLTVHAEDQTEESVISLQINCSDLDTQKGYLDRDFKNASFNHDLLLKLMRNLEMNLFLV